MIRILKLFLCIIFSSVMLCSFTAHANNKKEQNNIDEIATQLQTLIQYEIDGSFIVTQAMENVNNQTLRDKLLVMRQDCEENIKQLSALLHNYGREAPSHTKDFKGYFMQGYAAMRGLLSDKGVMKSLHTNMSIIMNTYEKALNSNLPIEVKDKVRKVQEVKRKHIQYIETQI